MYKKELYIVIYEGGIKYNDIVYKHRSVLKMPYNDAEKYIGYIELCINK